MTRIKCIVLAAAILMAGCVVAEEIPPKNYMVKPSEAQVIIRGGETERMSLLEHFAGLYGFAPEEFLEDVGQLYMQTLFLDEDDQLDLAVTASGLCGNRCCNWHIYLNQGDGNFAHQGVLAYPMERPPVRFRLGRDWFVLMETECAPESHRVEGFVLSSEGVIEMELTDQQQAWLEGMPEAMRFGEGYFRALGRGDADAFKAMVTERYLENQGGAKALTYIQNHPRSEYLNAEVLTFSLMVSEKDIWHVNWMVKKEDGTMYRDDVLWAELIRQGDAWRLNDWMNDYGPDIED